MNERPDRTADADESALVERARSGATTAQGELFRRHAPRLLPMLIRLLSSHSDAEDALQDTFISAFATLDQLKDVDAFGGWLRQVAVHQAHRRFRRRRLFRVLGLDRHVPDATLAKLADASASPELRAELSTLDAVLRRLPANQHAAWKLRYVEGYELEDVATACDCSLATAKRWIAAAQARVAKHLDVSGDDDE